MTPRLTVVVPIYNVEDFLDACLRSLAGQTMRDIDVVMVNDGSTDGSPGLARRFAEQDARFRLVDQENAGLGAARNAGVRHADGTYLTFVDSDDIIPEDAFARMTAALDTSGSDFVTGNVHRLRPDGTTEQSPMFRKAMAVTRLNTHVTRDWDLLGDRIACNKVFRKDFWDRHELAFPEGVLFEDIPLVVPAHFRAGSVDVLSDTVYLWRDRDGSISNRRANPAAVRDRTASVMKASAFLGDRLREAAGTEREADWLEGKRRYDLSVVSGDLWLFMEALPDGDAEYHEAFLDRANAFVDTIDPAVLAGLPLHLRVKWALIRQRRMPELLDLMAFVKNNPDAFRVRGLGRRQADYPVVTAPLPSEAAQLRGGELPLIARITRAVWEDGKLRIRGYAYVRNLPAGRFQARGKAAWLRAGRKRIVPLRIRTVRSRDATYRSRQGLHRYDRAGFETVVDPARLLTKRASTTWNLEMAALGRGLPRTGPVRMNGLSDLPVHYLDDFSRVAAGLSAGRLRLRAERVGARLATHTESGQVLRLHGELAQKPAAGAEFVALRVENWHTKEAHDLPVRVEGRRFDAKVRLDLFTAGARAAPDAAEPDSATEQEAPGAGPAVEEGGPRPWGIGLVRADGRWTPVAVRPDVAPGRYALGAGRELLVNANPSGNLELRDQTVRPIVDTLTWGDGATPSELVLAGSFPATDRGPRELLLLHTGHDEEAVLPVTLDGDRFRAALRPEAVEGPGGVLPLAEGRWLLFLREPGESDQERYTPVHIAPALHQSLPLARTRGGRELTVDRCQYDRLQLRSGSALRAADQGPQAQAALRERYSRLRGGPLRDTVLYSSFDGRQCSDSPRAVHRELASRDVPLDHVWVVRDQQAELPPGVRAVTLWSAEWHEALARSRYIVTNTQLPDFFERAEGQYVVQTWHGTPLKRIGRDLAGTASSDPRYIEALPRRAAQWSLLLSPNRFSTPILRNAFGYTGQILECGYPRNDVLYAADRERTAADVRERLGIPAGKRVVLYAPTWRENQPKRAGRYGLDLQLDLAAARRALGDDHVLLVRRHYLVGGAVPGDAFVRDVTRYPDVADLLLISDILVTDYSSLMFDFAQTGRPMLFHTYDLDHYRDTLRGFYLDFEAQTPGPLIAASEDVVAALRDPDTATEGHADAYEAFRRRYCDLDDGQASAAVADAMLASAAPATGPAGGDPLAAAGTGAATTRLGGAA